MNKRRLRLLVTKAMRENWKLKESNYIKTKGQGWLGLGNVQEGYYYVDKLDDFIYIYKKEGRNIVKIADWFECRLADYTKTYSIKKYNVHFLCER